MQTTETLKHRIKNAEDLQSVVRTMKALAAVSIRQYQRAVESLADYNRTVEMGLQIALRQRLDRVVAGPVRRADRMGAIVFGSDQGLCGPLNEQVAAHALQEMTRFGVPDSRRYVVAVGLRMAADLEDAGQTILETLATPGSVGGITPLVQDLILLLEGWHFVEGLQHVSLFYSEYTAESLFRPCAIRLLPVDQDWLGQLETRKWASRTLPVFRMSWENLFSGLIREYLFVKVYRAFAESLASENASRLFAMQRAEKNIEERLEELQRQYQQQRQMTITEELLDIVSGFEAMQGQDALGARMKASFTAGPFSREGKSGEKRKSSDYCRSD